MPPWVGRVTINPRSNEARRSADRVSFPVTAVREGFFRASGVVGAKYPKMPRSLLDLPLKARAPFFFAYLIAQLAISIWALRSPDFVFGFQMFNASSDMKISLYRRVRYKGRSRLIAIRDGTWQAKDAHGQSHEFRWQERVHDGVLGTLDTYVHASYGLDAQLFRLKFALEDVANHVPGDEQTEAFVALVDTVKNGREYRQVRLEAARP